MHYLKEIIHAELLRQGAITDRYDYRLVIVNGPINVDELAQAIQNALADDPPRSE